MKNLIEAHFEVLILVFIFVFATVLLAVFPGREEMARWIENGAIVTVIARSMVGGKAPLPPNTTNSTTVTETTEKNDQPKGDPIP